MAKTFRGVIKRNDLEGGIWELHAEDGERYQIRGGSKDLRVQGQEVEVQGNIDRQAMGIGMTGPILDISSWKAR